MSISTTHRSRLFQFGLRTMFAAIALVAICLGWQVNKVHERHAMRRWVEQNGGSVGNTGLMIPSDNDSICLAVNWQPTNTLPAWRRLLGDQSVEIILLPEGTARDLVIRAESLYPEASVYTESDKSDP